MEVYSWENNLWPVGFPLPCLITGGYREIWGMNNHQKLDVMGLFFYRETGMVKNKLFEITQGSVEGRCLSFKPPTSKIYEQLRLIGQDHHVWLVNIPMLIASSDAKSPNLSVSSKHPQTQFPLENYIRSLLNIYLKICWRVYRIVPPLSLVYP